MEKMNIRAIIFDFDGPILNSFEAGLDRIETLLIIKGRHFSAGERRAVLNWWGHPPEMILKRGLKMKAQEANILLNEWKLLDQHKPIPLVQGAREVLLWLRRNNIAKGLLTSRDGYTLNKILTEQNLLEEFTQGGRTSYECTNFHKPDHRAFENNLNSLIKIGIKREECLYIGDTKVDADAGVAASITTLLVLSGPLEIMDIPNLGLPYENILESIVKLPEWIERHNNEMLLFPDLPSMI